MSKYVDLPTIAIIFSIGAFIIALICLFKITQQQKAKKTNHKKSERLFGIKPEFIEEAKSEREHRLKQRKKYGIFDENGNRINQK